MILLWLIAILLAGGILCWLVAPWNPRLPKWLALGTLAAGCIMVIALWRLYHNSSGTDDDWFIQCRFAWIPSFGISFHLAADGLSLVLLILTFFLGLLSVLCSWHEIREKSGFYFFNLLWTLAGICGVFVAMDLFLFYFFWEMMLVPMYFLISVWGDANRRYAAFKFFLFTQAGGLLLLLAILSLYFIHAQQTGIASFDYFDLLHTRPETSAAMWIMMGFLIAFVIKLPVVPFHNWLPDAHSEAPTAGSLILAGLLLKTGAYGIIRFVLPIFPVEAAAIGWWAMLLGAIGILYGAFLAFAQTDLKRLIAYTSVSHMGFVMVGVFAFNTIAMQGVVMQILTHGISTGALFVIAGMLKERLHTRDIEKMGGLWTAMPIMGGFTMLFTMASLGLPMLGNFVAEFLVLAGAYRANVTLTVLATLGLVFSALYALRMMQRVFLGKSAGTTPLRDLNLREWTMMLALSAGIILLGLFPQPVMDMVSKMVTTLVK